MLRGKFLEISTHQDQDTLKFLNINPKSTASKLMNNQPDSLSSRDAFVYVHRECTTGQLI